MQASANAQYSLRYILRGAGLERSVFFSMYQGLHRIHKKEVRAMILLGVGVMMGGVVYGQGMDDEKQGVDVALKQWNLMAVFNPLKTAQYAFQETPQYTHEKQEMVEKKENHEWDALKIIEPLDQENMEKTHKDVEMITLEESAKNFEIKKDETAGKMKSWSWQHGMWNDLWYPLGDQESQKYELKKEDWKPKQPSLSKTKSWKGLPLWMGQWKQDSKNIKVSHDYNGLLSNIKWNAVSQMKWDSKKGKTQLETAYVRVQWNDRLTWQAGQKKWNLAGETEAKWGDSWAQGLGAAFKQDWWGGVMKTEYSMLKPVNEAEAWGWNAKLAYKKGSWSPLYTWTKFEASGSGIHQVKEQKTYSIRYKWGDKNLMQWSFNQTKHDKTVASGSHFTWWRAFH